MSVRVSTGSVHMVSHLLAFERMVMVGPAVAESGLIAISYVGASFGLTCLCNIPALVCQAFFAQVAKLFLAVVIDLADALA
eukprot:8423698-Pyramimonas_sp.AAC.1